MQTCEIQWIDSDGKPTPDSNDAVGVCWLPERAIQLDRGAVWLEPSPRYRICHEHAQRLREPGMGDWRFERFTAADLFPRFATSMHRLAEHYLRGTLMQTGMRDAEHFSESVTFRMMRFSIDSARAQD